MAVWTHQGFRPSVAKEGPNPTDHHNFDQLQRDQILSFVCSVVEGSGCPLPSSFDDFSDGIVLIKLLESLTCQPIKRYTRAPRLEIQKIDNINIAISFMETNFRLKVFGCNPKDIVQGNEKQLVGLLFLLMTRVRQLRLLVAEEEEDDDERKQARRFGSLGWWNTAKILLDANGGSLVSPKPKPGKEKEEEEEEEEEEEKKGNGKEKEKEEEKKEEKEKEEVKEKEEKKEEKEQEREIQVEIVEEIKDEKELGETESEVTESEVTESLGGDSEPFPGERKKRKKKRDKKKRGEKQEKDKIVKEEEKTEELEKPKEEKQQKEEGEQEKPTEEENKEEGGVKWATGVKFVDLEDDEEDSEDDDEYLVVTKKEEKSGLIRMQSFVSRFAKKSQNVSSVDHSRMEYLYEEFKKPENLNRLVRLQAVVRALHVQRAFRMKINRRNQIAQEILNTERSYKVGLDTLISVFQDPLISQKILTVDSARAIFGSVPIILQMCNTLLGDLEERLQHWFSEGQRIADIFLGIVKMLKIYTDYVNNYNIALGELARLRRTNKDFRSFLKVATSRCNGMDINSYLVLPIQRIPRYVMLLEQMYKYTPETHADYEDLRQVVVDIRDVADYVNDKKRAAESQMQVKKCSDQINGMEFDLVVPSRRYIYEGFLLEKEERKMRDRYVFLFNDLLLVSAHQKQKQLRGTKTKEIDFNQEIFNYKYSVDFEDMEVRECQFDSEEVESKRKKKEWKKEELFGFTVKRVSKAPIGGPSPYDGVFYALDVKTQLLWMARMDNSIAEAVDCRLSHMGITPDSFFSVEFQKEGMLEYLGPNGKWLERLVVLKKGVLSVYRVKDRKKILKESVPVGCCSVRVVEVSNRQNCFQISSASQILMFHSNTNSERYEWVNGIRQVIREIICEREKELVYLERMKDDPTFIIKDLAKNLRCQDCSKDEIGWGNITLGSFFCKQCGGIHRTLGYSVKMKAIGFGKWSMEEVELFRKNQQTESPKWTHPAGQPELSPSAPHKEKFQYLQIKYAPLLEPKKEPEEKEKEKEIPKAQKQGTVLGGGGIGAGTLAGFTNGGLSSSQPGRGKGARPHSLSVSSASPKEVVGTLGKKKGVICDGVLEMKRGGEWKAFYVTVKKNRVLQYRDVENRRRIMGEIDLQMVSVSCSFEVDRQYTFKINTLMKQHMFAAPSEGEIEKWVAAIGFNSGVSGGGRTPPRGRRSKKDKYRESSVL